MVSLTLKIILHVEENDSKYRDVAPLKSKSQVFKYNSLFLVPVYLTMLINEQYFLIMIQQTNKQTNKRNKTKQRWSHFHLGLLQGVHESLPLIPDDTLTVRSATTLIIFAIQVGADTTIVPPGSAMCFGAVILPFIIVLIFSAE